MTFPSWDWLLDKFEAVWNLRMELDGCKQALSQYAQSELQFDRKIQVLEHSLELERTRRISAEAIATERRLEADRLQEMLGAARQETQAILGDRLKSLDSLNQKLLEPRVVETPDLAKFREQGKLEALHEATRMTMRKHREADRAIDLAVISQLRNQNRARVTTQNGLEGNLPGTGTMREGGPVENGTDLRTAQVHPGDSGAA